tara:strand:+ start:295 stop:540 length:246 start_codon:yes stop_codon:yes gene_type:complete
MKYVLKILFLTFLIVLCRGYYVKETLDYNQGEKIIGTGVLFGAFIYLPLFLYHRWKDKKISNYTLTRENLSKMNVKKDKKN